MQAFYLLACWKEPDDDVSYLHSGYAFRILLDLDIRQSDKNEKEAARYRRTCLALFRQDKQQSLFFMRKASLGAGEEEGAPFSGELNDWLSLSHTLPFDFIACCNADIRRKQARLRLMAQKSSMDMFPCILDLMDSELSRWRATWQSHVGSRSRFHQSDHLSPDQRCFSPGMNHADILMGLWEQSVRLNIASVVLRQALLSTVTSLRLTEQQQPSSSLSLDIPSVVDTLTTDFPGLASSIEGAFGTLRQLLMFPPDDLRRSPDSVLLLGPNAALFLCLLLCLPCSGMLGHSFQRTATSLVRDVARHVGQSVRSTQDSVVLHALYLDSLARLLDATSPQEDTAQSDQIGSKSRGRSNHLDVHEAAVCESTPTSVDDAGGLHADNGSIEHTANLLSESGQELQMQTLANLLDLDFWTTPNAEPYGGLGSNAG